MVHSRNSKAVVCLCLFFSVLGCAKRHRPLAAIDAEKRELPVLYLTEETQKRVMGTAAQGIHVDEATGEICSQPFECLNPDCPGRTEEGNFLFVHRDVLLSVGPDKEIIYGTVPEGRNYKEYIESKGGHMYATCPKCLEKRDLKGESEETRQKYKEWVQAYELPETVQRRAELEAEYQAAFEARERVRAGE